jgi:hypothetical protein
MYPCPIEQITKSLIVSSQARTSPIGRSEDDFRARGSLVRGAKMLHNFRSKPDPLRRPEGAQVVTKIPVGRSSLAISAPDGQRPHETDMIMETLLREYYAPRRFQRSKLGR